MSLQCVPRASDSAERPDELDSLTDDLLAQLMRSTGVRDTLTSLPHNSRLHRAWQTAVEQLSISNSKIDEKDIELIKKYTNLKRLRLEYNSFAGMPAWQVTLEASCLEKLIDLSVTGNREAISVLEILASTSLRSRLQLLHLEEEDMSLRELSITSVEGALDAPVAPVFPGSLTGLTSLYLNREKPIELPAEERALIAAVSGLVNLQQLHTNYHLSPEAQQQALGKLTRLTRIYLRAAPSEDPPALHPQPQLSLLQELWAPEYRVHDPFVLPVLRELRACGVLVPEAQRHAVVPAWPLQELQLYWNTDKNVQDSELQGFPTVPSLANLYIYWLAPSGQPRSYLHLASMLHRHASHLQDIVLHLMEPFLEAFPVALPACRRLLLLKRAVGTGSLALLRNCALPALQDLVLNLRPSSGTQLLATLQQDLGWLPGLPALRSVKVYVQKPGLAKAQQALVALLPGKQVEVV